MNRPNQKLNFFHVPHGDSGVGSLGSGIKFVDLGGGPRGSVELRAYANSLCSVQLSKRELCDFEMIATGAFSPLRTFMNSADYNSVLDTMRLQNGTLFPIPITLTVADLTGIQLNKDIALRGPRNEVLAILSVEDIFEWDATELSESVLGTSDRYHPMVREISTLGRFNLSGRLQVINLPEHHDFQELRLSPQQTHKRLYLMGRTNVVAFHTRNPLHRAHEEMTKRAIEMVDGTLLLQPTVGITKPGDIDYVTRVRTYKAVAESAYPKDRVLLSIVPLAMRMAGPREAVFHAIVRRNYGATHFIVGRDHASPGTSSAGKPFYEPYSAQKLAQNHSAEIGIEIIPFPELRYLPNEDRWCVEDAQVENRRRSISLSGTFIRRDHLEKGRSIPAWAMNSRASKILAEGCPPRRNQGVCIWLTGLSGAGKSTTAEILSALLNEEGRQVTLLDGDVVRTHLSKGLGFSREDRQTNIQRIGFVASEIVKHGGAVVCATISPYADSREGVRSMFSMGNFIEVFVNTPLDICEKRDPKGMYAKARRGEITGFTGIDDTYEPPEEPEIVLNTTCNSARENAERLIDYLREQGFVGESLNALEEDGQIC